MESKYYVSAQDIINKAYCWLLGRCADQSGMQTFSAMYASNGNQILPIVRALVNSNEFYNKNVATYPTGQVDGLYVRLLGRVADPSIICLLNLNSLSYSVFRPKIAKKISIEEKRGCLNRNIIYS